MPVKTQVTAVPRARGGVHEREEDSAKGRAAVRLVARPQVDYEAITDYLEEVGGQAWLERFDRGELDAHLNDPQTSPSSPDACATAPGNRA